MKNIKAILVILVIFILSGCATMEFNVCGIDVKELKNAKASDYGELALGAVASVATHVAGHFIVAELTDVDIHLEGLTEVVDYSKNPSEKDLAWMARGGFVVQLAVNTALVELAGDSYFTKGFTAFTCVELLTYAHRHPDDGDFNLLDENSANGNLEHGIYTAWSAYNFARLSFKKEKENG